MSWFIFVGDMLVMLFMTGVVIWVSAGANKQTLDYSARIPLEATAPEQLPDIAAKGKSHG
jgi:hypothetical protein